MKQSVLANLILNQYFLHFRCLIILTEQPAYFEYAGKQQIINLSIQTSTNNSVFIQDFTTSYHGCQGFVVDASKPIEVFEFLEDKIRHSLERFKSRRYFFIIRNKLKNLSAGIQD
ncbi:hypothetical protein WA026_018295 [Henosepilachna vigintioctopunctata]|uniref:Uncharacterized protein n=1 Tax=Henosepilachna vigintioctopunctata TaxID=420089 RepID=A0AAW1VEL7_9CUCU